MAAISAARGAPTALTPPSSSHGDEPSWRYRNQHEVSLRRQPSVFLSPPRTSRSCHHNARIIWSDRTLWNAWGSHGLTWLRLFRRPMTKVVLDISATNRFAILARTETSTQAMTPRHERCIRRTLYRTASGMHMQRLASSRPNSTTSDRIGRLASLRRMR